MQSIGPLEMSDFISTIMGKQILRILKYVFRVLVALFTFRQYRIKNTLACRITVAANFVLWSSMGTSLFFKEGYKYSER